MRRALARIRVHWPVDLPPLLALTDPERVPDPVATLMRLPAGSGLVYRHFGAEDRQAVAARLVAAGRRRHVQVLIGNDAPLALAVGAAGVHWTEANLHLARRWRARFALMTGAAHSLRALKRAARCGLDAALLSPVFPSHSPSAGAAIGPLRFRAAVRGADLPVYALGGVHADTIHSIAAFSGAAAIDGIQDLQVRPGLTARI